MGDDHTAESSTTAHQSEFAFVDVMMPILSPAGVQEILDYGALGWALSRYAGVWVGIKCIKDTIESTAVVDASLDRVKPVVPADYKLPPGGLNIRTPDAILEQEARLQDHKRDAVVAWLAANKINRRSSASGGLDAKIGIITAGKSYLDVRQALDDLGIDEARCNALGLRLFKLGCAWPIVPAEMHDFARGLDLIIVVEEKRSLIEVQVREELYGSPTQPVCIGKKDETGALAVPRQGRARSQSDWRSRSASGCCKFHADARLARDGRAVWFRRADARSRTSNRKRRARPISARAARTIARP